MAVSATVAKGLTIAAYVAALAAVRWNDEHSWASFIGRWTLCLMLSAHALEFVLVFIIFKHKLSPVPNGLLPHLVPTLLYGFNHWGPMLPGSPTYKPKVV